MQRWSRGTRWTLAVLAFHIAWYPVSSGPVFFALGRKWPGGGLYVIYRPLQGAIGGPLVRGEAVPFLDAWAIYNIACYRAGQRAYAASVPPPAPRKPRRPVPPPNDGINRTHWPPKTEP